MFLYSKYLRINWLYINIYINYYYKYDILNYNIFYRNKIILYYLKNY